MLQGCCSCSGGGGKGGAGGHEDEPDYGVGYSYEPDFDGRPTKKRRCTDVVCLALFGAFLGAWGFVAYTAYAQGDVDKVGGVHSHDQALNFVMKMLVT